MYIGDYRAVSIHHPATCCRSAAALDNKRFLSGNAPKLPLANCTSPGLCQCEYRTLNDRREDFRPKPAPERAGIRHLAARLFGGRRGTDVA
jgi:hypothetical protein